MTEKDSLEQISMPGFGSPTEKSLPQVAPPSSLDKPSSIPSALETKKEPEPRDAADRIETIYRRVGGKNKIIGYKLPDSNLTIKSEKGQDVWSQAVIMALDPSIDGPNTQILLRSMSNKGVDVEQVRAVAKFTGKKIQEAIDYCSQDKNRLMVAEYMKRFRGDDTSLPDYFHNI